MRHFCIFSRFGRRGSTFHLVAFGRVGRCRCRRRRRRFKRRCRSNLRRGRCRHRRRGQRGLPFGLQSPRPRVVRPRRGIEPPGGRDPGVGDGLAPRSSAPTHNGVVGPGRRGRPSPAVRGGTTTRRRGRRRPIRRPASSGAPIRPRPRSLSGVCSRRRLGLPGLLLPLLAIVDIVYCPVGLPRDGMVKVRRGSRRAGRIRAAAG